jgi:nitrite reductase/ring-hydroxylating ferredoxin subunit
VTSTPEVDPADLRRLIVRYQGRTFHIPPNCPHRGAPLREAALHGPYLRCAWHGATFDVRSGARLRGPECPDLPVAPTEMPSPDLSAVEGQRL